MGREKTKMNYLVLNWNQRYWYKLMVTYMHMYKYI